MISRLASPALSVCLAVVATCWWATRTFADADAPITNPYHSVRHWKVWSLDDSPVSHGEQVLTAIPADQRLYPDPGDVRKPGWRYLHYRAGDWPERITAGMWDDVYVSLDNRHSYIRPAWSDNHTTTFNIINQIIHLTAARDHRLLWGVGANFTSQSTTGMGHDIANRSIAVLHLERDFYFANILRAGPAHTSFMDLTPAHSHDDYHALVPSLFNTVGSSGSETWALTKMVIAGGHLAPGVKRELKRHGLYPATMLYLWKAALPYDVPFDHELRHRVAYNAKGDHTDYRGSNQTQVNFLYHNYDEDTHLRNMIESAAKLQSPPPVTLLNMQAVEGGRLIYAHKTVMLVHQDPGQTIRLRISAGDSYDLEGRPLTFRWRVLHGHRTMSIEREEDAAPIYRITVPDEPDLPRGRTSILLIANNGLSDSNPAVVNIYRTRGRGNHRPTFEGLEDRTILPGQIVRYELTGNDPEGFPVVFHRWANEVGRLEGNVFVWACPPEQPEGDYPVTVIASDQTSGNSYASQRAIIRVRRTAAVASADILRGPSPLRVAFSSEGSRSVVAGPLTYRWCFDDGTTSSQADPVHTFSRPGFYQVTLTVAGPAGTDTTDLIIHVEPDWPRVIDNGWCDDELDREIWHAPTDGSVQVRNASLRTVAADPSGQPYTSFRMESVRDFAPPLYVQAEYSRTINISRPGGGFDLLGLQVDNPTGRSTQRDDWMRTIVASPTTAVRLGPLARRPWQPSILRLFVDADPHHPGRFRYRGFIENGGGVHFFRFDEPVLPHRKLAIFADAMNVRFEVSRFEVWAPGDK